jgi:methylmalonyl-CoA mutase
MAIQLIINKELGLAKNENPLQGAFIIEQLTDLVEEAVLSEFDRITERGGVPGRHGNHVPALAHSRESLALRDAQAHLANTPLWGSTPSSARRGRPPWCPGEIIRATEEEKQRQLGNLTALHDMAEGTSSESLTRMQTAATSGENMFDVLMEATKSCSLGQLTDAMFDVGGAYRRNM